MSEQSTEKVPLTRLTPEESGRLYETYLSDLDCVRTEQFVEEVLAARAGQIDALRERMEDLADEFDSKGRRGSAHFGADVGDTIRLWIEHDPRPVTSPESEATS